MSEVLRITILVTVTAVLIGSAPTAAGTSPAAQSASDLFQQARHAEEVVGDLQQAIGIYMRVVDEFPSQRAVVASALVRLGACYEKMGDTKAREAYERVVSEFADQGEALSEARQRLEAIQPEPTSGGSTDLRAHSTARILWHVAPGVDAGGGFEFASVSPDGKRVAYREGRLRLEMRDLESGDVTTLASGDHDIGTLAWSPDNRTIAFTSYDADGELRGTLQTVDTETRMVTLPEPTASLQMAVLDWSSDGYLLCNLIRPDGTLSLVRVATDSWEVMPLLSQGWSRSAAAVFSPDGKHVAFQITEDGTQYIDVMAVDGSDRHRLATDADWPLWSPDGRSIIYSSAGSMWAVSMRDGAPQGSPRSIRLPVGMWARQWTADGSLFLVLHENTHRAFRVGVDPENGTATGEVHALSGPSAETATGALAWSPDMTRIAFADRVVDVYSLSAGTTKRIPLGPGVRSSNIWWNATGDQLFTVPYGDPRIIAIQVDSDETRPLFAPIRSASRFHTNADGSMMVFYRGSRAPADRRLVVSRTGEPAGRVLASEPDPAGLLSNTIRPKFSPDGSLVLFGRHIYPSDTANSSLWVVSTTGSDLRRVAAVDSSIRDAHWSPDGRYIAYTDGQQPLVVDVENGRQHEIEIPADWGGNHVLDWSPDGRWLGVRVYFDSRLELWTIPDFRADEASRTAQR